MIKRVHRSLEYGKEKEAVASKRKMRRFHYGPEWPIVNRAFDNDINPILEGVEISICSLSLFGEST